ncbi:MAG: hypothetical protein FK734_14350 [Asgard group archaeon]|nr:hypothetical protein [Asgard group archaeon]
MFKCRIRGKTFFIFPIVILLLNVINVNSRFGANSFVYLSAAEEDPLVFSSYMGGDGTDYVKAVSIDVDGNIYIAGGTESSNFITKNALDDSYNGANDIFLMKLAPNGTLLYSTFFGGTYNEYLNSMTIDSEGNVYLVGQTGSTDYPLVNAYDDYYGNLNYMEGFLTKIAANGSTIFYSTFFGGSNGAKIMAVAVDEDQAVYIAGDTYSSDIPITAGAFQTSHTNTAVFESFITKFTPNGSTIVFSTFVGGSSWEFLNSMTIDSDHYIYACGETESSNYPTVHAYDNSYGGETDCFLFKLAPDGTSMNYSTFFGGGWTDRGFNVIVDDFGQAIMNGYYKSGGFPSVNPYSAIDPSQTPDFMTKFNANGTELVFSTYLPYCDASSITLDPQNNIWLTGNTHYEEFPLVNAFDYTLNGEVDGFISEISANGTTLLYSSFFGGNSYDSFRDIKVVDDIYYIAGSTLSTDFPLKNAFDEEMNGFYDAFVAQVNYTIATEPPFTPTPTPTPTPTNSTPVLGPSKILMTYFLSCVSFVTIITIVSKKRNVKK